MTTDDEKTNNPIQDFILDVIVPVFAVISALLCFGAAIYFWYGTFSH